MAQAHDDPTPSDWIVRHAGLVRPGGTVLDVAAGAGRHARFFLARGHRVWGVDRAPAPALAAADGERLVVVTADLEDGSPWPLGAATFDGVVVTNYLHRPLLPRLVAAVAPGGALLYETFAVGNERFGRPRSPDHLLCPGELRAAVAGALDVVAYEEVELGAPRAAVVQRIAAVRPGG